MGTVWIILCTSKINLQTIIMTVSEKKYGP